MNIVADHSQERTRAGLPVAAPSPQRICPKTQIANQTKFTRRSAGVGPSRTNACPRGACSLGHGRP